MDVALNDEQLLLRSSAREFLAAECPMSFVRRGVDPPERSVAGSERAAHWDALWQQMAELGWMGLLVGETHGGSGLDLVDLAILLEEMGRSLVPGPFLSTAVVGARAISRKRKPV